MKAKQLLFINHSSTTFNTISLDDEPLSNKITSACQRLPPVNSSTKTVTPNTSGRNFIETCYNHFFPNSRVNINASISNICANSRPLISFHDNMESMPSLTNSLVDATSNSSLTDRRRAKLTIAIDADEPYSGLVRPYQHTPSTAGVILAGGTDSLDSKPVHRSRSVSILSRESLKQSDRPKLKALTNVNKHEIAAKSQQNTTETSKFNNFINGSGSIFQNSLNISNPLVPQPVMSTRNRLTPASSIAEYSPPPVSQNSLSAFASSSNSSPTEVSLSDINDLKQPQITYEKNSANVKPLIDTGISHNCSVGTERIYRVRNSSPPTPLTHRPSTPHLLGMGRMRSYEAEDDFPYHNNDCGDAIERRHHQFAKESASTFAALSASTSELSSFSPFEVCNQRTKSGVLSSRSPTETSDDLSVWRNVSSVAKDVDFRRKLCEYSLADEMREATRKYKGTPDLDLWTPDRIFKVVFVGDSGVGKTCFLHRFCHNRFRPLFNATIGVDFIVKTIRIRDRLVAMQLWDTAGQERFRSITKQYFRKADGVVLMYDVTSEQSYLNVRNWIESVRVGVDDECIICLIGNKVDLYPNDECRTITYKHGADLAKEFDMIFFETSAYSGLGINDSMRSLAFRLQQREDEHLAEAMRLNKELANGARSRFCYCL